MNMYHYPIPRLSTTEVGLVLGLNEATNETPSAPRHVEIEEPHPR